MQVNAQSDAESTAKKTGLPASTEIILNETFSDFFVLSMSRLARVAKQHSQCHACAASTCFPSLFFDLRSSIATMEEGFSSIF